MKEELMTIYKTNDGIVVKLYLKTVSKSDADYAIAIIGQLIPKG